MLHAPGFAFPADLLVIMAFFQLSLDVFLGLVYGLACTFLLLVLAAPLPFKDTILKHMTSLVQYLMYGVIIPVYILVTSSWAIHYIWASGALYAGKKSSMGMNKTRLVRLQRNFVIGFAGVVGFILLYRFYRILGGAPLSSKDAPASGASKSGASSSASPALERRASRKTD